MLRCAISLALLAACLPAQARVLMTTKQALELAFPGCVVERGTKTLDNKARGRIAKLSGQRFSKSMVFPYVARRGSKIVGTAWFDVHKVRTKKQLLMVVVDSNQRVSRVEVLAFAEPRKYMASKRWIRRLNGQRLGRVRPGREVPRITGATLTVNATTKCIERVLATHRVVFGKPKVTTRPTTIHQKK